MTTTTLPALPTAKWLILRTAWKSAWRQLQWHGHGKSPDAELCHLLAQLPSLFSLWWNIPGYQGCSVLCSPTHLPVQLSLQLLFPWQVSPWQIGYVELSCDNLVIISWWQWAGHAKLAILSCPRSCLSMVFEVLDSQETVWVPSHIWLFIYKHFNQMSILQCSNVGELDEPKYYYFYFSISIEKKAVHLMVC